MQSFDFSKLRQFTALFWLICASTVVAFGCMQYNNNI
jgi:hypothetical protein